MSIPCGFKVFTWALKNENKYMELSNSIDKVYSLASKLNPGVSLISNRSLVTILILTFLSRK